MTSGFTPSERNEDSKLFFHKTYVVLYKLLAKDLRYSLVYSMLAKIVESCDTWWLGAWPQHLGTASMMTSTRCCRSILHTGVIFVHLVVSCTCSCSTTGSRWWVLFNHHPYLGKIPWQATGLSTYGWLVGLVIWKCSPNRNTNTFW